MKFSELLAKIKKDNVEKLFSEIQEESKFFEEYIREHQSKIDLVKKFLPKVQEFALPSAKIKKPDVDFIKKLIFEIIELNRRLWYLTNKILYFDKKERKLFHFIIKEKMNQLDRRYAVYKKKENFFNEQRYAEYSKELEPYFEQLFDLLKTYSRLILRQLRVLNKWRKKPIQNITSLTERQYFFHLLSDETSLDRKIRQNLILIIRTINEFMGYAKLYGPRIKSVPTNTGYKEVFTAGVVFHEIRDVNSINFEKFYAHYVDTFPPDERVSKPTLKFYLGYVHLKNLIIGGATKNHLVVGIIKGEIVTATFFSTYLAKDKYGNKKFSFGVEWWTFTDKNFRSKRLTYLMSKHRDLIMQKDLLFYGIKGLYCVFIEVEDPKKMSHSMIKESIEMGMDVEERIRYWRKLGYRSMQFDYIQPSLGRGNPIYHLMLMIKPFNRQWISKSGVPVDDMKLIYWYFIKYGFNRIPEREPMYWKVLKNMESSQVKGYVKFL